MARVTSPPAAPQHLRDLALAKGTFAAGNLVRIQERS